MLITNQKRGTLSLENSELYGLASSSLGVSKHSSVKGQVLSILGFEGHLVCVEALRVTELCCCRVNTAMDNINDSKSRAVFQ